MSSKISEKKEDKLITSIIEKEKKDNKNLIIYILIFIVIVLSITLCYFIFFNNDDDNQISSAASNLNIEVEPTFQYINYQGFKFKMPLDWDFISADNKYEISNNDSSLLISLDYLDLDYDEFVTENFQKEYLETLQTSSNIKINESGKKEKNKTNYYLFEGTYESYDYAMVAIGDNNKVILVNVQFQDKLTFNKLLDSVIDFSISIK